MVRLAALAVVAGAPAPETPVHRHTQIVRWAGSSGTCPRGSGLPSSLPLGLRWLAQRNHIRGSRHESFAHDFDLMIDPCKNSPLFLARLALLHPQHKLGTALRAGVLGQQ